MVLVKRALVWESLVRGVSAGWGGFIKRVLHHLNSPPCPLVCESCREQGREGGHNGTILHITGEKGVMEGIYKQESYTNLTKIQRKVTDNLFVP